MMFCSHYIETPTPLAPLRESVLSYLLGEDTWAELQGNLEQAYEQLCRLLEREDVGDDLAEVAELALDLIEQVPPEETAEPEQLRDLLSQWVCLDRRLQPGLQRVERRRLAAEDRRYLLAQIEQPVSERQLEAGHYRRVVDWTESTFAGEQTGEQTLDRLASLHSRFVEASQQYRSSSAGKDEWTAEVALADELLEQAFDCWLNGLEALAQGCCALDEQEASEGLELLRHGNGYFIMVERLAHLGKDRN